MVDHTITKNGLPAFLDREFNGIKPAPVNAVTLKPEVRVMSEESNVVKLDKKKADKAEAPKAKEEAKGKAPKKAEAPKAKPKAKAKESEVKRDIYGYKEGSLKSKAAAMYASADGATMQEVKKKLGSVQLNLLTDLEERGCTVKKTKEEGNGARPVTRYFLKGKPKKEKEAA